MLAGVNCHCLFVMVYGILDLSIIRTKIRIRLEVRKWRLILIANIFSGMVVLKESFITIMVIIVIISVRNVPLSCWALTAIFMNIILYSHT